MLVVGASLARAFGIVGAANLVRYRSKIDDPKDAAVMLCALAVGLACRRRPVRDDGLLHGFHACGALGDRIVRARLAEAVHAVDQRPTRPTMAAPTTSGFSGPTTSRSSCASASDEEVCYEIHVPLEVQTDDVSNRLLKLDPDGHLSVEWEEKKNKK